jgi:hypothetical protein
MSRVSMGPTSGRDNAHGYGESLFAVSSPQPLSKRSQPEVELKGRPKGRQGFAQSVVNSIEATQRALPSVPQRHRLVSEINNDLILAHSMPLAAVHTNRSRHIRLP